MSNDTPIQDAATISNCPTCGKKGTCCFCTATRYYVFYKCSVCGRQMERRLPIFSKKVVYLDQLVISNMVKAKDPFWDQLRNQLQQLISQQLVACPYSPLHRRESLLFCGLDQALQEVYKSLGGNDRFKRSKEIERCQSVRSLAAYLTDSDVGSPDSTWEDAFEENPNLYTGDMVVNVVVDNPPCVAQSTRQAKQRLCDSLKAVSNYRKTLTASFDEDLEAEFDGFTNAVLDEYRRVATSPFDCNHAPSPGNHSATLVHELARVVNEQQPTANDPVAVVETFLRSSMGRSTPFLDITCRLWAAIAQLERNPKGARAPKDSDSYDIEMLSHYAPYCDAMFIDNEFRGIIQDKRVDLEAKYGVCCYSSKGDGRNSFFSYLEGIQSSATQNHWDRVAACDPCFAAQLKTARDRTQ